MRLPATWSQLDIANRLAGAYWHFARTLDLPRYFVKAGRLYRWVRDTYRSAHGDQRSRIAALQNDFALFELATQSCSPAEALVRLRQALDLRVAALGPDHLDIANSLTDLGDVLTMVGELSEAELVLQRAVAMRRRALLPHHRLIATSLSMLANILFPDRTSRPGPFRAAGVYCDYGCLARQAISGGIGTASCRWCSRRGGSEPPEPSHRPSARRS